MSGPTAVSLFSGIGGFDLGLERAGFTVVAQVENDAFCQRVLAARFPHAPSWADVRQWQGDGHEHVAVLAAGFPCQDLSVAGKRAGLSGARSGLFYEYVRIAKTIAPTFGLVENVPGLVSSRAGRDLWAVLEGLRECWPVVGYRILDSQYFGVAQRRRRVFLVGGPTEASVSEILALTEGGGGDLAAGGQAGADIAYALAASVRGTGDQHGNAWNSTYVTETAYALRPPSKGADWKGDGADTIIAFDPTTSLDQAPNDRTAPPLKVGTGLASMPWAPAVAFVTKGEGKPGRSARADMSLSLRVENQVGVAYGSSIRRLTPLECERLQGFPDGWSCLCQELAAYAADPDAAALACRCPDSPRYRALGNAVTVPVVHWIAQRISQAFKEANP